MYIYEQATAAILAGDKELAAWYGNTFRETAVLLLLPRK